MSGAPPPPPPPAGFPLAGFIPPVPPPWTEHKAPNGVPYWFNPITNVSTYVRPGGAPPPPPPGFAIAHAHPPPPPAQLPALHYPPISAPAPAPTKKEKKEKPKTKTPLGESKWIRVVTNKGNVFYNHSETKESVWTVPEEVKELVDELEKKEREEEEEAKRKAQEEEEEDEARRAQNSGAAAAGGGGKKRKAGADDDEENGAEHDEEEEGEEEDEQERGNLDLEIEIEGQDGAETSLPERPAAAEEEDGESAPPPLKKPKLSPPPPSSAAVSKEQETAEAAAAPPKKAKKQKPKVVAALEDLADEDWQRQIAEEMAREAEAEAETAEATTVQEEQAPIRNQQQGTGMGIERIEVDQIEAAALFTVLLSEKDINPMAPFESELPKFVNDPRYHAVKGQKERRDLFDQFCKDKIREQRAAKRRAAESGVKVDPLTAYRQLLSTAVTSTRTHFSDFKRQHAKDARFREFGKTEGEREKEFKKWLRELGERKRAMAERAEKEFGEMLGEDEEIKRGDKWSEVKKRHASDPRYAAVNSSSLREQLFEKHLASLGASASSRPTASTSYTVGSTSKTGAGTTSKEDKAARAAASLREREEKVRAEKMKNARSAERARGHLGKEEAEREFAQLLVDAVRDHSARFDDVTPTIANDPRFDAPSLHPSDKRRLFDAHQQKLYRSRISDVEALFAAHAPKLTTSFDSVLPSISSDPHVTRLVGPASNANLDQLESLYSNWLARRTRQAREDFTQMLKENSVLEHWGRMQKMEKREKGKLIGEEGVREDSDEEEPDSREMAEQIDLRAIHAVLRNDKRYLEFDHVPEDREKWVEEYVNNLAAPKTTVHQRE
ncbi:hypothetical protein JCM10908_000039 [Rhodotorula pacifica]|uniref:uncharacterized protein n=1 Tax=Rhodotorula pacifica TaxID=1495444 RepID=UPI003174340B